jgi:S-adenosylmethionine:tRNA ribosyltransferase-isomerase
VKVGVPLVFPGEEGWFELVEKKEYGRCRLRSHFPQGVEALMAKRGQTPIPPYIKRNETVLDNEDMERYQTVYARTPGSIAAPTAGLHFTKEVLDRLSVKGVDTCRLTLHVGPATFQPIRVQDIEQYTLPPERVVISSDTARKIREAKSRQRRIVAVGTTSTRALESSAARNGGEVVEGETMADLYIRPHYHFRVIDGLITNFHLPQSSLLVLVSAFVGRERVLHGYTEAIREGYRFYSYGDCMAIL